MARPVTHSCLNTALILGLGERVELDPERVRLREEVARRLPHIVSAQQDNPERGSCKGTGGVEDWKGLTLNLSSDNFTLPEEKRLS